MEAAPEKLMDLQVKWEQMVQVVVIWVNLVEVLMVEVVQQETI